jgi:hypothetical protein
MELGGSSSASARDAIYTTARDVRHADAPSSIRRIIEDAISEKTPSDEEIFENLRANDMTIRGIWNFRTLLKLVSIEEERRGPLKMKLNDLDIEHIAPRRTFADTKYAEWRRKLEEDEFDDRKDKLGNLTLLLPSDHSGLDETSFEDKKHTYTNSDVKIAEEVASYDDWNDEKIEQRTELLAEELISRWSI